MRKLRKLLGAIMLILSVVVMQLPAFGAEAAETTASVSEFVVDSDGVLTKYNGTSSSVIVPANVVTIGTDAFRDNSKLTSIVISDNVKYIEPYAFWNCSNLTMVSIGKGLSEIGDFVFANCKSLASANIPSNITRIGIYAFQDDISLTDITIPIETMDIHKTAFDGCYKLVIHAMEGSYPWKYAEEFYERQKEFPEYEDVPTYGPDGNTDNNGNGTGDNNGSGDGTTDNADNSVIISDEVIKDISSVHVVGNKAVIFMNGTSPNVYFGGQNVNVENIADGEGDGTGSGTGIDAGASVGNASGLPKYTIVDGTVVADQAYYMNNTLSYVALPETIKEIGEFSYARSSISSIVLPEGLEKIGYGAFYHADDLGYVTIPDSVKKIEPNAFEHTKWVDDFRNGEGDSDFLISGGALIAYRGSAEEVEIPDGVKLIAAKAFENHTEIKSVKFPESLVTIGEDAFAGCKKLAFVNLEETGLYSVLDRAFYNTALKEVTLPETFVSYGINAFDPDCNISFNGTITPTMTHESTAERLSNGDYRENAYKTDLTEVSVSTGEVGVNVSGLDGVKAMLEGATKPYYLYITKLENDQELSDALKRADKFIEGRVLSEPLYYDIELTDKSGISITRLGHQGLTVAIPAPDGYISEKMTLLTVDRNGQLEEIKPNLVKTGEGQFITFTTYHLSTFGIFKTGEMLTDGDILTAENVLEAHAAPPEAKQNVEEVFLNWLKAQRFRIIPAAALLITGFVLIIYKKRRI